MEWSDWCYWDVSVVTSLLQFVLHELHPDDIAFKVIHAEYTIKDTMCFQLKLNVKFIIFGYIGNEAGNEHYSHTVIDIVKGKAHVRLWILMLMHKWIASTLRYATVWALVLQILYNTCTYTLICI